MVSIVTRNLFSRAQIDFIQRSGIVTAMVGLLTAPTGTKLYKRLREEGRLLTASTGNNTDFLLNFIPKMDPQKLVTGYKQILNTIYSPKEYYQRIRTFLKEYKPKRTNPGKIHMHQIKAFFRSIWFLGIRRAGQTGLLEAVRQLFTDLPARNSPGLYS